MYSVVRISELSLFLCKDYCFIVCFVGESILFGELVINFAFAGCRYGLEQTGEETINIADGNFNTHLVR